MRRDVVELLIGRCRQGERKAFDLLLEEIRPDLLRIVHAVLGPSPDIDDVLQAAGLEVFRSLASFRGAGKFSTWLYGLTYNVARQHLRRQRGQSGAFVSEEALANLPAETESPLDTIEKQEIARLVAQALGSLDLAKRTVLVLHDMEDLGLEEIGTIVGANRLTVKSRLYYARKEFARQVRRIMFLDQTWARDGNKVG